MLSARCKPFACLMNKQLFRKSILASMLLSGAGVASGQLLITQYYEGSSNNKFLELTNIGSEPIDLSTYTLSNFFNQNTELWKTESTAPTQQQLSGTLAGGASYVLANSNAVIPRLASAVNMISGVINFNGDDSMVLYNGLDSETGFPIFSPANIVDVVSFTDAGSEGMDTSIVRKTTDVGFDFVAGTTFLNFPLVWEVVTLADANSAVLGQDYFLGSSAFGSSSPIVSFSGGTMVVNENITTAILTVQILNPGPDAVSVDVGFDAVNSTASLNDVGNYLAQAITFPAGSANGDSQTVTVTVVDDVESETSEDAIFVLENLVTGGDAAIGGNEAFTLTIVDNDTNISGLYLSEIADPSDFFLARFVEIHNPTASDVDLDAGGWTLVVYFNANTSGEEIALTGVIPAGGLYVVARDGVVYTDSYPNATAPNLINSAINFNGDDNLELRFGGGTLTGTLVDVYGLPGTDGTGTEHEYTDSQVTRNTATPNAVFTFSEWTVTPAASVSMTPGSLVPVDPPVLADAVINGVSIVVATGQVVLTASGLGNATYIIQSSLDLGLTDEWAEVPGGYTETDNGDAVDFAFTDAEATSLGQLFYRILKQ